jgi:type IV secretory pathway VirB10-like protein
VPAVEPAPPVAAAPSRPDTTPAFDPPPPVVEAPPAPPVREFVEVVIPASSVIGLQLDTSLSSERARVEDRVDARVTRDVTAGGRVAIPAGSRVIGSVTLVERGGKIKERARLGVRFHTLVFADGTELPIKTEAVFREGESPSGESARKIGGAAAGGAILGAILGGGKGAVLGGAAGAAGGTAATMAGDRNPASLSAGTVITVRLTDPVSVDVEKRETEGR